MGEKRRILVIRANSLDRENRAVKIMKTLLENGFRVRFMGWDRGVTVPRSEKSRISNLEEETYFNFKSPWGKRSLAFLPFWWAFLFYKLMTIEWDAAHVIQIISLPPVAIAGKIRRKQVVYDILDTYEDSIMIPTIFRNMFMAVDKLFIRMSSNIVLADEEQIKEFNGIPHSHIAVLYDSPDDIKNQLDNQGSPQGIPRGSLQGNQQGKQIISQLQNRTNNHPDDKFILFFAGQLNPGKKLNLENMFEAVRTVDDVKIIIAGHGDLVGKIKNYSDEMKGKIEFIGEINHDEVLNRSLNSNALFMIRDSILPVNKYICGSKVLEAMMCSKPIIVSHNTSTALKVATENCGLVVDPHDIEDIKKSITTLKNNPKLCQELGSNGRIAYQERYSWNIMEKRLMEIYNE